MLTGIPFGVVEYFILKPEPLALGFSLVDYVLLALAVFIGFVEGVYFAVNWLWSVVVWGLLAFQGDFIGSSIAY